MPQSNASPRAIASGRLRPTPSIRKPRLSCCGRRRTRLALVATLAVCTMLWVNTPAARGGTYLMKSCNVPGARSAPAAPWRWINTTNTYSNDECGSGGGFGINAGSMDRVSAAAVVLDRPSAGPISAITIRRVRLWMVARLSGAGSSLFIAWSSGGPTGTTASASLFGPPGGDTLSVPYATPLLAPDTASFVLLLSCSGNTFDGCAPASINPLEVRGAEVTLQEDVPPTGAIVSGSLLAGGDHAGVRTLDYTVTDEESGVAKISAVLGTTVVATQDFTGECAHADFAACPRNRAGTLPLDTRVVPNGSYPLTLRITDAAGNQETTLAPAAVQVMNAAPASANGHGATGDARLTAGFAGRRGVAATTPYGRSVSVRGALAASNGRPIANARIEVTETPALAGRRSRTATVITRANGKFRYNLRARGMSRSIRFRYRPSLTLSNVAASARLRLNVAAAATLRVRLRGIRVGYSGRVLSRPMPKGGKRIYVQGRAIGGAWTTFAIRRSDRLGRFSGSYRLRVRRPGVRLQFRVRIPKQRGYPYAAAAGRALTRTVR